MINLIYLIAGLLIAGTGFFMYERRKPREARYCIAVKFAYGTVQKITLNAEQYEQFKAWLNHPDGIFDIASDMASVTLDRRFVAAVEAIRR